MDGKFGVYLASPAGGCVSFLPELYVNPFDSRPVAYSSTHTQFSTTLCPVASYPSCVIDMLISAGLLYIHSRSKATSALGSNLPFRAYTAAIWFFLASNVFLVVVPWIPPPPEYQVYENIPYYVSKLCGSRFRVCMPQELTANHLASYSYTVSWHWRLGLWASCIGM